MDIGKQNIITEKLSKEVDTKNKLIYVVSRRGGFLYVVLIPFIPGFLVERSVLNFTHHQFNTEFTQDFLVLVIVTEFANVLY